MLRRPLIALSHSTSMRRFVIGFPPARRVARRFVAGERREDALTVIRQLNDAGLLATIDYLGEHVTTWEAATANGPGNLDESGSAPGLEELRKHFAAPDPVPSEFGSPSKDGNHTPSPRPPWLLGARLSCFWSVTQDLTNSALWLA